MCTGKRRKLYALLAGMLLLLVTQNNVMCADDVALFKITDTEGYIGLRHRYDSDSTQQVPNPVSKETRSVFEEEIHVDTHGYVYHPNLLKVDLGGGVLFNQEKLQLTSGSAEYDDTLYELSARLMFLEKKPYPLIMYYDKSHPSIALNVTDVFIQENEKYGMNFSLLQPLSPVTLNFETYQQSNKGSSFKQVVDDRNYYDSVRAHSNLANGGHAQLSYTKNQKQSMSGLKSMTINPFNITTKTTDLNSLFVFGKEREINLNVNATQIVQEEDRKLKETRFSPRVSWEHNKDFNSFTLFWLISLYSFIIADLDCSSKLNLGILDILSSVILCWSINH